MLFNLNKKIQSQKGAALLAFVLVMLVGSSFLFISKLNSKVRNREDIEKTYDSLNKAKQALIGFALTIPERSNANPPRGPGFLPCPDTDNDGFTENACGVNSIGRLPHRTLDIDTLLDGSGEVLWYALSDNYRNNPVVGILNSESPGELVIDNTPDIVAVIFAPGPALVGAGQNRTVDRNDVIHYLEDDNQDLDDNFISNLIVANPSTFNDKVVAITRQELMSVVEKRVLAEVDKTLNQIWSLPIDVAGNPVQAYPWLRTFADPTTINDFRGIVNTRQGFLPLFLPNTSYAIGTLPLNIAIPSDFTAFWDALSGGVYNGNSVDTATVGQDPSQACVIDDDCNEVLYCVNGTFGCGTTPAPGIGVGIPINNAMTAGIVANPDCSWDDTVNIGRNSFECSGDYFITNVCINDNTGICFAQVRRNYSISYRDLNGSNVFYTQPDPTPGNLRNFRRFLDVDLDATGRNINNTLIVTVTDFDVGTGNQIGQASYTTNAFTGGFGSLINISGIEHHIDSVGLNLNPGGGVGQDNDYADPGEFPPQIPQWFVDNNWHHLVHIAYPVNETVAPGSAGAGSCAPPPAAIPCITLTNNTVPNGVDNNIRALAIISGDAVGAQVRAGAVPPNAYLDIPENTDTDDNFDNQLSSNAFNDQFRIINP